MTGDGELMLTLLASFAQAESEQLSANVKWRVEKQFEKGLANGFRHYGYTNSPDGTDVEIIEHEAAWYAAFTGSTLNRSLVSGWKKSLQPKGSLAAAENRLPLRYCGHGSKQKPSPAP